MLLVFHVKQQHDNNNNNNNNNNNAMHMLHILYEAEQVQVGVCTTTALLTAVLTRRAATRMQHAPRGACRAAVG